MNNTFWRFIDYCLYKQAKRIWKKGYKQVGSRALNGDQVNAISGCIAESGKLNSSDNDDLEKVEQLEDRRNVYPFW